MTKLPNNIAVFILLASIHQNNDKSSNKTTKKKDWLTWAEPPLTEVKNTYLPKDYVYIQDITGLNLL